GWLCVRTCLLLCDVRCSFRRCVSRRDQYSQQTPLFLDTVCLAVSICPFRWRVVWHPLSSLFFSMMATCLTSSFCHRCCLTPHHPVSHLLSFSTALSHSTALSYSTA